MMNQQQRPVTYGDVFPNVQQEEPLASQPVTIEDAALMQSAESHVYGQTPKLSAASAMQSAAQRNVNQGLVDKDAHTPLAEFGMTVTHTELPGVARDVSYVAGSPVQGYQRLVDTDPEIAGSGKVTIGEALEAAAVGAGDKPIDDSDARAIQCAESKATGGPPIDGGVGSEAQAAADWNPRLPNPSGKTTLADVLTDATLALPADKVVTREDAKKVVQAELRGKHMPETLTPGGVGESVAAAANLNELPGAVAVAVEHRQRGDEAAVETVNPLSELLTHSTPIW